MVRKITNGILSILERVRKHHLFSFAATSAFFLLLSFIPFILILLVFIRYTSISETDMMNAVISAVPTELEKFVSLIVREVYTKSIAVVPVSVVIALWSAAKGFHALSFGLDVINGVPEDRGFFYMRFRSMLLTVIFAAVILLTLFLMVFSRGTRFSDALTGSYFVRFVITNRYILSCVLLTLLFILLYRILPNKKTDVISQIPGAVMVGVAWTAFSWFLSIFYSPTVMNTYGSLTAVILAMIWLYFCMYFFLFGAELNSILQQAPENNLILSILREAAYTYYCGKEEKAAAAEYAGGGIAVRTASVRQAYKRKRPVLRNGRKRKAKA